MSLDSLVINYGYPILFVGVMLEGETFLIIAAFLAHRGYLTLPAVMLVAFLGAFATDQLFFLLGRTKGSAFLAKRPAWQAGASKVRVLLERHDRLLIIGFRFLYGLRTVTPFVIGMSGFPAKRFLRLNVIGEIAWTVVMASAGYAFGQVIEVILGDVRKYELWIVLGFAVVGSTLWLWHLYKRKLEGQLGPSGIPPHRIGELYRQHFRDSRRERLFLSSLAFFIAFGVVRAIAYSIHQEIGPLRNVYIHGTHVHHLVFGICLLLIVGYLWLAQVGTGMNAASRWVSRITAILYGIGAALTLDEFALWLNLEDVYWTGEGRESVDAVILFGALLSVGLWGTSFLRALIRYRTRFFRR